MLHKIEAILSSFVLSTAHIDVEVVFVEAIKYDLNVAWKSVSVGSIVNLACTYSVP